MAEYIYVCTFLGGLFFHFFLILIFNSVAGLALLWLSAWCRKLSQLTDCSWGLQDPRELNFTYWNLLLCSKTHFLPTPHSLGLKVDKQLSGNWTILSSEETRELGQTRCGNICSGEM